MFTACRPGQPRAFKRSNERAVWLLRSNAKLVLPPAILCEDPEAVRLVPDRLADIEDEKLRLMTIPGVGPVAELIFCTTEQQQNIKGRLGQCLRHANSGLPKTVMGAINEIRRLRQKHTDRLLTLLAVLLSLAIFVFAPLQAMGIYLFQGFAIAALLAVIGGMIVISENPAALAVMAICFVANVVIFVLRLYFPPWPYNLYGLAGAWLAIAITLGVVVAQAVFRRGRVTHHRIFGAILLYLLIAVAFGTLFIFVGLSLPDAFKGITFEDNSGLANSVFYLSFVTLTSTGYGDIVPVHPIARSLCNIESVIGQLYPATLLARLVTLELRQRSAHQ